MTHAALDQGYQPSALPRNPPRASAARTPNEDLEVAPTDEQVRLLQEAGALAPDLETDAGQWVAESGSTEGWGDGMPRYGTAIPQDHIAHEVTVTVVTRYPAIVMGRIEHLIEEHIEEALWVSTVAFGLTRAEG